MIILSEHDAFSRLIEGLRQAQDGAKMLAAHQPEKAFMWEKLAQVFAVNIQAAYKLSQESAAKVIKS